MQRLQPKPFKGTRGGVGRCRQTGRARAAGGEGAEVVVTSALLRLHGIPRSLAASGEEGPAPERRRRRGERRPEKAAAGGRRPTGEGRWRLRMRPGAADIKPGPAAKAAAGVRALGALTEIAEDWRRRRGRWWGRGAPPGSESGGPVRPPGWGWGGMRGARGLGVSALFHTRPTRARAGTRRRGERGGEVAGAGVGCTRPGRCAPACGMDNEAFLRSDSITSFSSQEPAAAATATT